MFPINFSLPSRPRPICEEKAPEKVKKASFPGELCLLVCNLRKNQYRSSPIYKITMFYMTLSAPGKKVFRNCFYTSSLSYFKIVHFSKNWNGSIFQTQLRVGGTIDKGTKEREQTRELDRSSAANRLFPPHQAISLCPPRILPVLFPPAIPHLPIQFYRIYCRCVLVLVGLKFTILLLDALCALQKV